MTTINGDTFSFLNQLKINNNREWFDTNRERYSLIREDFILFLESVYPYICKFDPEIEDIDIRKSVFRINRDVRFSNDKSPYKISLAAVIIKGGRKNFSERAGYYLHLEPGKSMIAGGAYMPPSSWINRIRREISSDSDSFREIINEPSFKRYFGGLSGDQLKGAPRGYDRDNPDIDLLKFKSYLAVNDVKDDDVLSESFGEHFIGAAKAMKPLNDFLNWEE